MAAAATVEAPPASTAAGKTPLSLGYTMPGKLNSQHFATAAVAKIVASVSYSFIHPSIHPSIHPFIHSFIHSFIHDDRSNICLHKLHYK